MTDYVLPYRVISDPTDHELRNVKIPLQNSLRKSLNQTIFIKDGGAEDPQKYKNEFLIKGYRGDIPRLRDAITTKFRKHHASTIITVLVEKLREDEEDKKPKQETPESVKKELEDAKRELAEFCDWSATQQAILDAKEEETKNLTQGYDAQFAQIAEEHRSETDNLTQMHQREKSNLETLLSETKKENTLLEDRNKGLRSALEGAYNPHSGPNSVICSSMSQQSVSVKKLDTLLRGAGATINEILQIGAVKMHEYVNSVCQTNLTFESIGNLSESPDIFERTPEYDELHGKFAVADGKKKILELFSSPDQVPAEIKDAYLKYGSEREQIEKDISAYKTAESNHENSMRVFDQIREHTQKWRRCNHAFGEIRATQWTIPVFVTNDRENGNYKLEIAAPTGEPDGVLNGMLEEIIKKSVKGVDLQFAEDKGLNRYIAVVPAERVDDIMTALYGIGQSIDKIFSESDLAKIAQLDIMGLSRTRSVAKTDEAPAASQTA